MRVLLLFVRNWVLGSRVPNGEHLWRRSMRRSSAQVVPCAQYIIRTTPVAQRDFGRILAI